MNCKWKKPRENTDKNALHTIKNRFTKKQSFFWYTRISIARAKNLFFFCHFFIACQWLFYVETPFHFHSKVCKNTHFRDLLLEAVRRVVWHSHKHHTSYHGMNRISCKKGNNVMTCFITHRFFSATICWKYFFKGFFFRQDKRFVFLVQFLSSILVDVV